MLSLTERFPEWKDFPKGLHVLLVDKNSSVLNDVKSKLEAWDYDVTAFSNESDAFVALQSTSKKFHVLVIEAPSTADANGFKLLQAAENIPTIMTTDTEDVAIVMQGIALGASDFLHKPLSDEKLKNIWQHVARKAISIEKRGLPASLQSQQREKPQDVSRSDEPLAQMSAKESKVVHSGRFSAPPTPQLERLQRISLSPYTLDDSSISSDSVPNKTVVDPFEDYFSLPDNYAGQVDTLDVADESCHSCSDALEQLTSEIYADFQFDDNFNDFTLSSNLMVDENVIVELEMDSNILSDMSTQKSVNMSIDCINDSEGQEADAIEEESMLLAEVAKAEKECEDVRDWIWSLKKQSGMNSVDWRREANKEKKYDSGTDKQGKANKNCVTGKKKLKVDWTPELHRRFVQAVEQLGINKAIPSRILEIMGVESLTRHNVASHLQKYRSHRKHLLARDADATNWNNSSNFDAPSWTKARRECTHHSTPLPIQPKLPLIHVAPPLHVWGHPTVMWQKPDITASPAAAGTQQTSDDKFWQQKTAFPCAWGHPVPVPRTCYLQPTTSIPLAPMPGIANMAVYPTVTLAGNNTDRDGCGLETGRFFVFNLPQETVDAAITEVLKNPWAPLPLGLKPPSLDSVMLELQRQGITSVLHMIASS